ncbi:MAG: hypothetical protein ACI3ZT_10380 [Candidatus Cryptobacteroides sp.]
MATEFDDADFISYKIEDERWAFLLQKHLYILAILKEIPRLQKCLKSVFSDKTDLGAGGLTVSLHKELERSRFLV